MHSDGFDLERVGDTVVITIRTERGDLKLLVNRGDAVNFGLSLVAIATLAADALDEPLP